MTQYKQELFKLWRYTVPLCGSLGTRLSMPLNFYHDFEERIIWIRECREGPK